VTSVAGPLVAGLCLLVLAINESDGASPVGPEGESFPVASDSLIGLLGEDSAGVSLIDPYTRALRQAGREMPWKDEALVVGEKLTFSVRYGLIRAGEATLEITGIEDVDGWPCYHVVSLAKSNSVFDKVYRVRDRVESWMDADFLYSRRFRKELREGSYRRDQTIEMDHEHRLARYQDGRVFEFAPGAHDVLSAFYYLRTQALEPDQEIWLESHADRKNYPLRVKVHGKERVETPAGRFDCVAVEPMLRTPGLFKHEGKLTIWLTDDHRRMPVLMKTKIPIGTITVTLTDHERPR
jgi:hypothetical protein